MNKTRVFTASTAFAAVLVSGMALIGGTTGALAGTGVNVTTGSDLTKAHTIVHDHRTTTTNSPSTTTPKPPPAAALGTAPTAPKVVVGNQTRDHRAGGNADACLKSNNTCNAAAKSTSITAYREKNPGMIGLDGDPCLHNKGVCSRGQVDQSLIARAQKNLNVGFCDSRIKGQGCAQIMVLPNGQQLTLHYDGNKGHLLPADQQTLISELQKDYNQQLGGGGGRSEPKRQQF